jgi:transposase
MSPSFVKPYVKSQKNDAADAEAICEAVQRPTMRFVAIKSCEQQAVIALHTARDLLTRQQTMVINACRACLSEFGVISKTGSAGFSALISGLDKGEKSQLPEPACAAVRSLVEHLQSARAQIRLLDAAILAWHRRSEDSRRLATIPGIGVTTEAALVAHIADRANLSLAASFQCGSVSCRNSFRAVERRVWAA